MLGGWYSYDTDDPTLPVVWFDPKNFPNGIGVGSRVLESCRPHLGPQPGAVVEAIEPNNGRRPIHFIAVTFSGPFNFGDDALLRYGFGPPYIPVIFETEINT